MAHARHTRRSVLALLAVGLAGCTGSDDRDDERDDGSDGIEDDGDDREVDDRADREESIPDRDVEPDWDSAATFRTWLRFESPIDGGNRRFDYTEVFPDGVDFRGVLPPFADLTIADVDAHLVQGFTQVFFGSFDVESIAAAAEDADVAAVLDTYEGFVVVEEERPDGRIRTLAVGAEAIVIGDDYAERIDAHLGEADRLEDVDPEFTHLFRRLPHRTTVTGQYDSPAGGTVDVDEIYCWGVSSESPTADEMTWVFVLESAADLTDDVLAELEAVSSDVRESRTEGRTATIVGAPPTLPDGVSDSLENDDADDSTEDGNVVDG